MSLSDLASISFIIQGVLLIVSVALVWYQLRENTDLVRASNTQKLVELSTPFYLQIAQNRELADLWRRAAQNFDDLDVIDRERYMNLLIWWLMLHENIYHQRNKKLIDEDTYLSWNRDLEYLSRRQRLSTHWTQFSSYFEASFSAHVAEIIVRQTKEEETA